MVGMTQIKSIAKNASYLTMALALQKVISFTYFTFLARNLGPEQLGKYYFAISFTTVFAVIIDAGLGNVLTREVAKKKDKAHQYLGNVLTLKVPLTVVCLAGVFFTINLLGYEELTRHLVYISAAVIVLDSFTTTFYALARSFHNLKYESLGVAVFQLIIMVLGLSALYSGLGLRWIMSAMLVASIFNFIYSLSVLRRKLHLQVKLLYDREIIRTMIKIAIPFGLYIVFHKTFLHLDSVLLSLLAGDRYVGLYQIAFKIIFALQFIPLAFVASFYPAMSFYWVNDRQQLIRSFERAVGYLVMISLPISAGVVAIADKLVLLFKEQFLESVLPLQIIILSAVFIFLNFPLGSFLNACDKQKQNTANMGIALAVSIVLNLILIPKYQAVGASITVLAANMVMTSLGFFYAWKTVAFRRKRVLTRILKTMAAAALMGIFTFWLKHHINIVAVIALGGMSYFVLLFLFRAFSRQEVKEIYGLLFHKQNQS